MEFRRPYEHSYDLFGVPFHLVSDSYRVDEVARFLLGAHEVAAGPKPGYRLEFQEVAELPELPVPGRKICQGQEHQILEWGDQVCFSAAEGVALLDRPGQICRGYVLSNMNGSSPSAGSAPLLQLLVLWVMFAEGFLPIHASAVDRHGRLLVFSGEKGSGKSTLALRFHLLGYPLVSDDLLYLRASGGLLQGGGHCQPVKLKSAEARLLPSSYQLATGAAAVREKLLYPAPQFHPEAVNRMYPVEAVVFLEQRAEPTGRACVLSNCPVEVLHHLLGDGPLLTTPAYRALALELFCLDAHCSLHLAQTSPDVDETVGEILRAVGCSSK